MNHQLFRKGGLFGSRKMGHDQCTFNIPLLPDKDGRLARQCPDEACSPGYFKVRSGTGVIDGQTIAYCPYCRHQDAPNDFATHKQVRYASDIVLREVNKGVQNFLRNALGIGPSGFKKFGGGMSSVEIRFKPGTLPYVHRPFEEEIQRAIICPNCGLDHAVFGIAVWCPDCGSDIFLTHVQTELAVVSAMLSDIDRRRVDLGQRVATRDLENCLEDIVSIFEAVLKAVTVRCLCAKNGIGEDSQTYLRKIGTTFQSLDRTAKLLSTDFGINMQDGLPPELVPRLKATFEKRHPITHNLGVADQKYIERGFPAEREGREIRITKAEVEAAVVATEQLLRSLYGRLVNIAEGQRTEQGG